MAAPHLHIVMYPWFALGHIIPYLQLSNKLAKKGHKISFFIPRKTQAKLEPFNLYPNFITFIPITLPHVDDLPLGAETTADVPDSLFPHIMTAMDLTENDIERFLRDLKPSIVFFDFTHWMTNLTRRLGIKSSSVLHCQSGSNRLQVSSHRKTAGKGIGKPVLLSGILIPETPTSALDKKWATWLGRFKAESVIYCAFGSECILKQEQFQELLLGLEQSGMPFLAALKPPMGFKSVEAELPDGFQERVEGKGIVEGGWIQQQLILEHPFIGCFVTHCGRGSLSEALVNRCQLVLLPHIGDHIFNARLMSNNLKVGVEVEKGEEDGLFNNESVCKAVRNVMDDCNEAGREIRANRTKLRLAPTQQQFRDLVH
ncbi:UDP-glycosyltransferase [Quillaja saponaria]|uniref:UDP-glycosyltransferase n=1 Tax=Quillaja saponaria TaxID=32244 RepID=A0AAD7QHG6_QUISA|nr:UDP-glycosyltransferase [Quillaja saponaria]